jgi:integrase/recombinase XerD
LALSGIEPFHIAAYVEELQKSKTKPTVKQRLACIRMLFDCLVVGQVVALNPAKAVRGPKHSVAVGATPVLSAEETRMLLDSIDTSTVVGLRDRALIGLMVYSFSRIEAAVSMKVEDFYPERRRWWVRLHEKGAKVNKMPCHHNLEDYLHEYIKAAGIKGVPKGPVFRSAAGRTGVLTSNALDRVNAWQMVRRRAKAAGIETAICNRTFRATGITEYLRNGGKVEIAQQMAGHADPRTTRLYDRRQEEISLDEVERAAI